MTPSALISDAVKKHIRDSFVKVSVGAKGYALVVSAQSLNPLPAADRVAEVYQALDKIPLDLLAKIGSITCPTSR